MSSKKATLPQVRVLSVKHGETRVRLWRSCAGWHVVDLVLDTLHKTEIVFLPRRYLLASLEGDVRPWTGTTRNALSAEPMLASTKANTKGESAELRKFREEWKEEVRRRRRLEEQHGASTEPIQRHEQALSSPGLAETHSRRATQVQTAPAIAHHAPVHTSHSQSPLSGTIARAVEIYRSAVQHEQDSDLDEALKLYRQAFRINPDVDRAYFKEEQRLQQLGRSTVAVDHRKTTSAAESEGNKVQDAHITEEKDSVPPVNGVLFKVLENFPKVLTFEPDDDREGVPINMIPEELLLGILRSLDTTTLERFATVSRKARVLCLDPSIWRDFVYLAYKPPQIQEDIAVRTIVDEYANYRQTYIEHPRLRLDGVYIAVCHYVRRGLSESAWVNVSHLITYHRYLRFFPDGQVLSLLANEEHEPALVIPLLKPSLRMKGFYVGEWRLRGTAVLITDLVERNQYPHAHALQHNHVPQPARYHFQMTLTLRSKPLGRWNKLDFASYESVNVADGEVVPLPLKNERPFWFSKVKSWQGY